MPPSTYLVLGDLHGRVLPAFAIARAWQREFGEPVTALLQVGDMGYFPFLDRLDRATRKFARDDPLELGVTQVVAPSPEADDLFADPTVPGPMWFVAGNHEDHEALLSNQGLPGSTSDDFPVDAYGRLRCVVDGRVAILPGGLRVGGLWGIDGDGPGARRHAPALARIEPRRARQLAMRSMDVLVTHDAAQDVVREGVGSEAIEFVIEQAQPAFAFFGHHHDVETLNRSEIGSTRLYHLEGLEFGGRGGRAEPRSLGVLRVDEEGGRFEYVERRWLASVTKENWRTR